MKRQRVIGVFGVVAVLAGLVVVGCGKQQSEDSLVAPVRGHITMDGLPLADASIIFIPDAGGRSSGGATDSEGNYELTYNRFEKGAVFGMHRIRITTLTDQDESDLPAVHERVPVQYNQTTTLQFFVEEGVENIADFDISSEGEVVGDSY